MVNNVHKIFSWVIILSVSVGVVWLAYHLLFAYCFVLGMRNIIDAISETSCLEPLAAELTQHNARLDLGFVTLNPGGDICMIKSAPDAVAQHPCDGLTVVSQKIRPNGSIQTCFHFDAWLNCVAKSNGWGGVKSSVTEWASKQANLRGQVYCFDVPGTQAK